MAQPIYSIILQFLVAMAIFDLLVVSKKIELFWNSSNPIFDMSNTDNVVDVNLQDQLVLFCPVYNTSTPLDLTEQYFIYNVSKPEYDSCRITNPTPRIIAVCDKPYQPTFFTLTFRPFTPQPGGLEFLPGQDYYFISTSTKTDIYSRIGGSCISGSTRMIFKVCCQSDISADKNRSDGGVREGVARVNNLPTPSPSLPSSFRSRSHYPNEHSLPGVAQGTSNTTAQSGVTEKPTRSGANRSIQTIPSVQCMLISLPWLLAFLLR